MTRVALIGVLLLLVLSQAFALEIVFLDASGDTAQLLIPEGKSVNEGLLGLNINSRLASCRISACRDTLFFIVKDEGTNQEIGRINVNKSIHKIELVELDVRGQRYLGISAIGLFGVTNLSKPITTRFENHEVVTLTYHGQTGRMRIPEGYTVDTEFMEQVSNAYLEYSRDKVRNPWGSGTDEYLIYTEESNKRYPFGELHIDPDTARVRIREIQGFNGREIEFTASGYIGDTRENFCDKINGRIVVMQRTSTGKNILVEDCGDGYTCVDGACINLNSLLPKHATRIEYAKCTERSPSTWYLEYYEEVRSEHSARRVKTRISSEHCPYGCVSKKCVNREAYTEIQRILNGIPKIEINPENLPDPISRNPASNMAQNTQPVAYSRNRAVKTVYSKRTPVRTSLNRINQVSSSYKRNIGLTKRIA